MGTENNPADWVSRVILAIARSTDGANISTIASNEQLDEELIRSIVQLLCPFGAIKVLEPNQRVAPISAMAADFLRSFAALVERDGCLIQDWHREGTHFTEPKEILERGVCLLYLMEQRRTELKGAKPISEKRVVNILVKAVATDGQAVFLMTLNDRSQAYQFVGRRVQQNESFEDAAHRIISTSMPHAHLSKSQDYRLQNLTDVITTQFVSPTYGAFTSFETVSFRMAISKHLVLSPNHRWCSLQEIQGGQTWDGHQIIPPKEVIRLNYLTILERMERSFDAPVEIQKHLPEDQRADKAPSEALHRVQDSQQRHKNVLVATLCLMLILGGTIAGLSYASSSPKFSMIVATIIPVLIISLLFVAATSGIINGKQMVDGFKWFGGSPRDKRAKAGKKISN